MDLWWDQSATFTLFTLCEPPPCLHSLSSSHLHLYWIRSCGGERVEAAETDYNGRLRADCTAIMSCNYKERERKREREDGALGCPDVRLYFTFPSTCSTCKYHTAGFYLIYTCFLRVTIYQRWMWHSGPPSRSSPPTSWLHLSALIWCCNACSGHALEEGLMGWMWWKAYWERSPVVFSLIKYCINFRKSG